MSVWNLLLVIFTTLFSCTACQKNNSSINETGGASTPGLRVTVTTIAGQFGQQGSVDGEGAQAKFVNPGKICFDPRNNTLYVADHIAIRSFDASGNVNTYMGTDKLNPFDDIRDIDIAPGAGGSLYFTTKNDGLYKIEPNGNSYVLTEITKGMGNADGPLNTNDHIDGAFGVAPGLNGDIALYNTYWNQLKRINASGIMEPFAGKPTTTELGQPWPYKDGSGDQAAFGSHIYDICSDGFGNIYLPDRDNVNVRKITPAGVVSSFLPYSDADGGVIIAHIKADGIDLITASNDGGSIFFTSRIGRTGNSSSLLRMLKPGSGVISIAGFHDGHLDGAGTDAAFGGIAGLATTPDGKTIYVAEDMNKVIRKITLQ